MGVSTKLRNAMIENEALKKELALQQPDSEEDESEDCDGKQPSSLQPHQPDAARRISPSGAFSPSKRQ